MVTVGAWSVVEGMSQTTAVESVDLEENNDVAWEPWRLQSPATPLFVQPFALTPTKENFKPVEEYIKTVIKKGLAGEKRK